MIKKLVALWQYLLYEVGLVWVFHPLQYRNMSQMEKFGKEVEVTHYTIHFE